MDKRQQYKYYLCQDRENHWKPHIVGEHWRRPQYEFDGKPALDHIMEVSKHWNEIGHNQTQAEREKWYNDPNNLQIVCTTHNSRKGGEPYKTKVGPRFKGEGEK
jgi:hypothetical protein